MDVAINTKLTGMGHACVAPSYDEKENVGWVKLITKELEHTCLIANSLAEIDVTVILQAQINKV